MSEHGLDQFAAPGSEVVHPMLSASHIAVPMATFNYLYKRYMEVQEVEKRYGCSVEEILAQGLADGDAGGREEEPEDSPDKGLSTLGEGEYDIPGFDLRPATDYARMRYMPQTDDQETLGEDEGEDDEVQAPEGQRSTGEGD